MTNFIVYTILFITAIVHTIILVSFIETIFIRKSHLSIIRIFVFVINVVISFVSTALVLEPVFTGIITIIGWISLVILYVGKVRLKILYLLSFFVVNAVLELFGLYLLGVGNVRIIDEFIRVKAFVVATIFGVCVLLVFKHAFQFGTSRIRFKTMWSIYFLPIIALIFDTVIFYKIEGYTVVVQTLIIVGSLLLACDAILIANRFDKNQFELQKYANLNNLFKEQQKRLKILNEHEKILSVQVHRSDATLLRLYTALQENDAKLAKKIIENRLLDLNTHLVKINNPIHQISIELLIDEIQKQCDEEDIQFIKDIKSDRETTALSLKDQLSLISVIFNYALEELAEFENSQKFFKLKVYQRMTEVNIFVSYSKKISMKQLEKPKYRDFSRKSYGLQFVELIVKKYSGRISLRLTDNSFGMLLTLHL